MWVLWLAFAGCAALDWYAVWRGRRTLEAVAKPLTMVALLGAALSLGAAHTTPGRWLLVALALSSPATSRSSPERAALLAGLGAFLLGHLAYVAALRPLGGQSIAAALPGLGAVLLLVLVVGRPVLAATRRQGEPGLAGAVAAYMVVIGAMVVTPSAPAGRSSPRGRWCSWRATPCWPLTGSCGPGRGRRWSSW